MKQLDPIVVRGITVPVLRCGALVIGSGAASLAAADRLAAAKDAAGGAADIVVATEDIDGGTSYNTGSDKQTYYRLSTSDRSGDSPYEMAEALWKGGAVHGDIALAEALGSVEAFYHLVSIGVPFPMNDLGAFVGYKTDHDPRRRGTSIGPYTSRVMVERLRAEVAARKVPILDRHHAIALIRADSRVLGALFVDGTKLEEGNYGLVAILAEAVVFGTGGPGGLYGSSVYPKVHSGAIGLAIDIGAACANLTESQFGLASIGFRWNVSGTYQQAVPCYVSVGPDGDEEDFLTPFFQGPGTRDSAVFLKGYQWPFDPKKVENGGSSLVDLLVHRERVIRNRRVYMDFRRNSEGWDPALLSAEAREYLEKSGALEAGAAETPLARLERMNPIAVEHYLRNGIDLRKDMLEIALCAQHNNGGLAADAWWESVNLDRLFPVGEVNGSHGIYRPGGAALNSGQVGAHRAARRIIGAYLRDGAPSQLDGDLWREPTAGTIDRMIDCIEVALGRADGGDGREPVGSAAIDGYKKEFMDRMDRSAGIIRSASAAPAEAEAAEAQIARFAALRIPGRRDLPELFRTRHLVLAHAAYLAAVADYAANGGGTRGSALVAGPSGRALHPVLDASWNAIAEKEALRDYLQELRWTGSRFIVSWIPRRGIPDTEDWFEVVWRNFREGRLYSMKRGT